MSHNRQPSELRALQLSRRCKMNSTLIGGTDTSLASLEGPRMRISKERPCDRRNFLKGAASGAAALLAKPPAAKAQRTEPERRKTQPPSSHQIAFETTAPAPRTDVYTTDRPGADFMVDVLKTLIFDYICANPGSSFRGLQESFINYGGNKQPEWITCCHEESSVAMAHGYFKIEGKPLAICAHGTVGLQHAAMAIYNAYCDRVPVYIIIGNTLDATMRQPGVEWVHSVQDAASMVRDYTKWDDTPQSLQHFGESAVRAYKVAMTPPYGPVVLVADTEMQERPIPAHLELRVPRLTLAAPPQGDSGAVAEVAKLLVAAESPVLVADRMARTAAGIERLVELAELLQAGVVSMNGRMNFPTRHPLNQSLRGPQAIADADVVVGLETVNFFGAVNTFRDQLERSTKPLTKSGAKLINITAGDLS